MVNYCYCLTALVISYVAVSSSGREFIREPWSLSPRSTTRLISRSWSCDFGNAWPWCWPWLFWPLHFSCCFDTSLANGEFFAIRPPGLQKLNEIGETGRKTLWTGARLSYGLSNRFNVWAYLKGRIIRRLSSFGVVSLSSSKHSQISHEHLIWFHVDLHFLQLCRTWRH